MPIAPKAIAFKSGSSRRRTGQLPKKWQFFHFDSREGRSARIEGVSILFWL
jgi:RNase P/RNase MRP subunit p29